MSSQHDVDFWSQQIRYILKHRNLVLKLECMTIQTADWREFDCDVCKYDSTLLQNAYFSKLEDECLATGSGQGPCDARSPDWTRSSVVGFLHRSC